MAEASQQIQKNIKTSDTQFHTVQQQFGVQCFAQGHLDMQIGVWDLHPYSCNDWNANFNILT